MTLKEKTGNLNANHVDSSDKILCFDLIFLLENREKFNAQKPHFCLFVGAKKTGKMLNTQFVEDTFLYFVVQNVTMITFQPSFLFLFHILLFIFSILIFIALFTWIYRSFLVQLNSFRPFNWIKFDRKSWFDGAWVRILCLKYFDVCFISFLFIYFLIYEITICFCYSSRSFFCSQINFGVHAGEKFVSVFGPYTWILD